MEYIIAAIAVASFVMSFIALKAIRVLEVTENVFSDPPVYELARKPRSDKGKKRGPYKKGKQL